MKEGIFLRMNTGEMVFCFAKNPGGYGHRNVLEKFRITSHFAHDKSTEKDFEEKTPTTIIPLFVVKGPLFIAGFGGQ